MVVVLVVTVIHTSTWIHAVSPLYIYMCVYKVDKIGKVYQYMMRPLSLCVCVCVSLCSLLPPSLSSSSSFALPLPLSL